MSQIIIPEGYRPILNTYDTQRAIGTIKRLFADTLSATLNLRRVSAPLFVEASTGLNDDLNGTERKVAFDMKDTGCQAQVVQSLAKWKRQALRDYDFHVGKGLYTDMNAIRRDEELDNLHSVYVDQWDWEKVISEEDRTLDYLKRTVRGIVSAVCATEMNLHAMFPDLYALELRSPDITFPASHPAERCADILVRVALEVDWDLERLLRVMLDAGREASERIMEYYDGVYSVEYKEDKSPLPSADVTSNDCICAMLRNAFPEYDILSEEAEDTGQRLSNRAGVFIVDPLDGTKEFLSHNGEFCVSIGFAQDRKVRAGVIAVPAREMLYYAAEGIGAYRLSFGELTEDFSPGVGDELHVSDRTDGLVVTVSRSHLDADTEAFLALNRDRIAEVVTTGSCLKGCMIAEGRADLHWRTGAFMKEWDTAAMQIITEEAGARFTDADGAPLPANREDPRNLNGFLIVNRPGTLEGLRFPEHQ